MKKESQAYSLLDKYNPLNALKRAPYEYFFEDYKSLMEDLRSADEELRDIALGNNIVGISLKDVSKQAEQAFNKAKYVDSIYFCILTAKIFEQIKSVDPETIAKLSNIDPAYLTRGDEDASLKEIEDFQKSINNSDATDAKTASFNNQIIVEANIFGDIARWFLGDPILKAYEKQVKKIKNAIKALVNKNKIQVNQIIAQYAVMSKARAGGKVQEWVNAYKKIVFLASSYNGILKSLLNNPEIQSLIRSAFNIGEKNKNFIEVGTKEFSKSFSEVVGNQSPVSTVNIPEQKESTPSTVSPEVKAPEVKIPESVDDSKNKVNTSKNAPKKERGRPRKKFRIFDNNGNEISTVQMFELIKALKEAEKSGQSTASVTANVIDSETGEKEDATVTIEGEVTPDKILTDLYLNNNQISLPKYLVDFILNREAVLSNIIESGEMPQEARVLISGSVPLTVPEKTSNAIILLKPAYIDLSKEEEDEVADKYESETGSTVLVVPVITPDELYNTLAEIYKQTKVSAIFTLKESEQGELNPKLLIGAAEAFEKVKNNPNSPKQIVNKLIEKVQEKPVKKEKSIKKEKEKFNSDEDSKVLATKLTPGRFSTSKTLSEIMAKEGWSSDRTNAALQAGKGKIFESAKRFGWKLLTETSRVDPLQEIEKAPETKEETSNELSNEPSNEKEFSAEEAEEETHKYLQQMLKNKSTPKVEPKTKVEKPKVTKSLFDEDDEEETEDEVKDKFDGHIIISNNDLKKVYGDDFESIKNIIINNYKKRFDLDEDANVQYMFLRKLSDLPEQYNNEKYRKYNLQDDDRREAVSAAMKLKTSNKIFFNNLKKIAETNDFNLVVEMLLDYSEAIEDLDPNLSQSLLLQAKSIID